jgi:plastocyanin
MPSPRRLATVLAAASIAGCGGADPPVRADDGRVEIRLDDFFIEPQRIRAPARSISFEIVNRGRLPHTFRVEDERLRVEQKTLAPGASATVRADLARGRYRMFCAIANHEELGMHGTLVVR